MGFFEFGLGFLVNESKQITSKKEWALIEIMEIVKASDGLFGTITLVILFCFILYRVIE